MNISLKELESAIYTGTPAYLIGPPGIGKTSALNDLARKHNLPLVTFTLSAEDSAEVLGLKVLEGNRTIQSMPDWLDTLASGGILFFDDFHCTPAELLATVYRVIQHQYVGKYKLHEDVIIVAAGNDAATSGYGFELSPPMANRLKHYHLSLDESEFINKFPSYWNNPPIIRCLGRTTLPEEAYSQARSLVAGYLSARRQQTLMFPLLQSEQSKAWPSPRTWDKASVELAAVIARNHVIESCFAHIEACLGTAVALEFMTWLQDSDLPNPEEIFKTGYCDWPSRSDKLFATLNTLSNYAIEKIKKNHKKPEGQKTWNTLWTLLVDALNKEITMDVIGLAARDILQAKRDNNWTYQIPVECLKMQSLFS